METVRAWGPEDEPDEAEIRMLKGPEDEPEDTEIRLLADPDEEPDETETESETESGTEDAEGGIEALAPTLDQRLSAEFDAALD